MKTKAFGLLLIVAMLCFAIESMAQAKAFKVPLNASFQKPLPDEQPVYILELTPKENNLFDGVIYTVEKVRVVARGEYTKYQDRYLENGKFTYYFKMGNVESEGEYEKGARVGYWKRFNPDGSEKTERYYNPEGAAMLRKALGYDKL